MDAKTLKELLHYDPLTGDFTWLVGRASGNTLTSSDSHGYTVVQIGRKGYKAHRLAWLYMTGSWPVWAIDHKDHDRSNNKWSNLRDVPPSVNHKNRSLNSNNKSGFTGVHWVERDKKWRAIICVNGKNKHLGQFEELNDAIIARKAANLKYGFHENHGQKSKTK